MQFSRKTRGKKIFRKTATRNDEDENEEKEEEEKEEEDFDVSSFASSRKILSARPLLFSRRSHL